MTLYPMVAAAGEGSHAIMFVLLLIFAVILLFLAIRGRI